MNVYTAPTLLDVAGAVEALSELSLDGAGQMESARARGANGAC